MNSVLICTVPHSAPSDALAGLDDAWVSSTFNYREKKLVVIKKFPMLNVTDFRCSSEEWEGRNIRLDI